VVLSSFTNFDYACNHCSRTLSSNSRWDIQYDKSTCKPSSANSASPKVKLGPGTNSASPEPDLSYLLPANPAGGHSFNCGTHVFEFRNGLGRAFASPEPGLDLHICNEKAPNVMRYCRADALLRGLFPNLVLCQPLRYEQPPR
jgi:hypothetical protein